MNKLYFKNFIAVYENIFSEIDKLNADCIFFRDHESQQKGRTEVKALIDPELLNPYVREKEEIAAQTNNEHYIFFPEIDVSVNKVLNNIKNLFTSLNNELNIIRQHNTSKGHGRWAERYTHKLIDYLDELKYFLREFSKVSLINKIEDHLTDPSKIELEINRIITESQSRLEAIKQIQEDLEQHKIKAVTQTEDKKIAALKSFYSERTKDKVKEKKLYSFLFYSLFIILVCLMSFFVYNLFSPDSIIKSLFYTQTRTIQENSAHQNIESNQINTSQDTKIIILFYIIVLSIIGMLTFLMNDFRKRFNIAKNILDDIQQKLIILDSIPALIARNKEFSEVNPKEYENNILLALIQNTLTVKSYGYVHKDMQNASTNNLIELMRNIVQK